MNRHQQLQQKFRKANEEMLAADLALREKLSEANIERYRDAVQACSTAQAELAADGWATASKRLAEGRGLSR